MNSNHQDELLNISAINREFRAIAQINNWQSYHTPKNLASAISVEAGELLAEFQWLTPEQSCALSELQKAQVGGELADLIMYATELAKCLDINLGQALSDKIAVNSARFGSANL